MIAVNRTIGILIITATLVASGCATNYTTREVPLVPGTDTTNVSIFVNNDDGSVLLTGQVRKKIDATAIEEKVRSEYGYTNIDNRISVD